jgi:solute carrier family 25 protein 44
MVQGLPGTTCCRGPFDVIRRVAHAEGFRGLYRGFGLTAVTQSPASALWWGSYGAAQHIIWRYIFCLGIIHLIYEFLGVVFFLNLIWF